MQALARLLPRRPVATTTGTYWGVGSRLQWDVTKSFYIGVEAHYQKLDSATDRDGAATLTAWRLGSWPTPARPTVANQSNWVFTVRMHKDFLP